MMDVAMKAHVHTLKLSTMSFWFSPSSLAMVEKSTDDDGAGDVAAEEDAPRGRKQPQPSPLKLWLSLLRNGIYSQLCNGSVADLTA